MARVSLKYLLESWIWSSARLDSRAAQSTRCWARIPINYMMRPLFDLWPCLTRQNDPRMIFDDPRRKWQKLFTWDIGLVICFLDGKELISFFFDISHDFLQFFDQLVQSDVDLVIGLSPFVFDFFQSEIFVNFWILFLDFIFGFYFWILFLDFIFGSDLVLGTYEITILFQLASISPSSSPTYSVIPQPLGQLVLQLCLFLLL